MMNPSSRRFSVDDNQPVSWGYCPHGKQRSVLALDNTVRLRLLRGDEEISKVLKVRDLI